MFVDMRADKWRDICGDTPAVTAFIQECRTVRVDICADKCAGMCVGMCIDTCVATCVDMVTVAAVIEDCEDFAAEERHLNDMYIDVCVDMCIDMCVDIS